MKRILFIHHGSSTGGAFDSLLYLLEALDRSRYEIFVCAGNKIFQGDVKAKFSEKGFDTCSCDLPMFAHTTGGGYNLFRKRDLQEIWQWFRHYAKARLELNKLLDAIKPDLVHFNSLTLAPYACVARRAGIPNVVHIRESVLRGTLGLRRAWLRRHLVKYADKVIAICRDNLARLDIHDGLGSVVYNPIPLLKFDCKIDKKEARMRLGVPVGAKVVLMTASGGALIKGYAQFIQTMNKVATKRQDVWCLTPGHVPPESPRPQIDSVKRIAAFILGRYREQRRMYELGHAEVLSGRMLGCAYTRNVEQWIAAADVVCVPYVKPHFSRTVLEAGGMKKPVVASRIAGVEECVRDGETGLLVPPGDERRLAAALERLLDDERLRDSMGECNYRLAAELGDSLKSAQAVMKVYEELLTKGPNAA